MTESDAPPVPRPLWDINRMTAAEFATLFAGVFEHSPWVSAKASLERPFPSKQALLGAMAKAVAAAPEEDQLALLRAHPMLGGEAAKRGRSQRRRGRSRQVWGLTGWRGMRRLLSRQ
jgi:2-oxo-4-hydroxy-4-carboxy-5-ureidoimidazoline decarboxylase